MELLTKCPKVENTKADGMAAARFPFFAKTHKRVMPDKGGYHMENGYEVSASFAECENTEALGKVKQILLSSFAAYAPKPKGGDILALSPRQRDNSSRQKAACTLKTSSLLHND